MLAKLIPPDTAFGDDESLPGPLPNLPLLLPQQYAAPPCVRPQAYWLPASTCFIDNPPTTSDGSAMNALPYEICPPSPTWPMLFAPQQYALPNIVTAQVKPGPASTSATSPGTAMATGVWATVLLPVPNWRQSLLPQQ